MKLIFNHEKMRRRRGGQTGLGGLGGLGGEGGLGGKGGLGGEGGQGVGRVKGREERGRFLV